MHNVYNDNEKISNLVDTTYRLLAFGSLCHYLDDVRSNACRWTHVRRVCIQR